MFEHVDGFVVYDYETHLDNIIIVHNYSNYISVFCVRRRFNAEENQIFSL